MLPLRSLRLERGMNPNPGGGDNDADGGGDAPLHEALDDLEHMIGPGGIPVAGRSVASAGRVPHDASQAPETAGFAPPTGETPGAPLRPAEPTDTTGVEAWDPALYRMAAERLASEVEIIVNARLEAALARLGEDLRRELRNHIEIVLPEIVSTLADDDIPPRHE